MKLTLLTPQRKLLDGVSVDRVVLNGSEGQIEVLPGHAQMMGTLETGTFAYSGRGDSDIGFISTGFFEIKDDTVTVLAETLELKKEINISRAEAAQQKAEQMLKDSALASDAFKKFQLKLERAIIRQQIIR
ncbi:MAG: ATP synthase F1 subunit epsilon [Xanthomonadaceae bacterium]|nr:ATP synthase F1 subunit epsilon [Xanthomonadaceae bacterium]